MNSIEEPCGLVVKELDANTSIVASNLTEGRKTFQIFYFFGKGVHSTNHSSSAHYKFLFGILVILFLHSIDILYSTVCTCILNWGERDLHNPISVVKD